MISLEENNLNKKSPETKTINDFNITIYIFITIVIIIICSIIHSNYTYKIINNLIRECLSNLYEEENYLNNIKQDDNISTIINKLNSFGMLSDKNNEIKKEDISSIVNKELEDLENVKKLLINEIEIEILNDKIKKDISDNNNPGNYINIYCNNIFKNNTEIHGVIVNKFKKKMNEIKNIVGINFLSKYLNTISI